MSQQLDECLIKRFFNKGGLAEKFLKGGKERDESLSILKMYSLLRPECKECVLNVMAKMIITKTKIIEIPDCVNEKKINIGINIENCLITKVLKEEKIFEKLEAGEIVEEDFFEILQSKLSPFPECLVCFSRITDLFLQNKTFDIKDLNCLHILRTKEN